MKTTEVDKIYSKVNLLPGDPYLIHRIVGHYEYTQALLRLVRFVRLATEVELAAAEQIVRDEKQYNVFSLYGKAPDKEDEDTKEGETYEYDRDIGLARLIALARVELGAMLGGFAKFKAPFDVVETTEYELEAFKEFVFEGARKQFEELQDDSNLQPEYPPTKRTLAIMRRLNIARHFVVAAARLNNLEIALDRRLANQEENGVEQPERSESPPGTIGPEKIVDYPRNMDVRADGLTWVQMKATLDKVYEPFHASVYAYINAVRQQQGATRSRTTTIEIQSCFDGVCTDFAPIDTTPQVRTNFGRQFQP